MKKLLIEGGKELNGTVRISGAKNSAVALLPATILANSPVTINDLPNISDIHILGDLLKSIGGEVYAENSSIRIEPEKMSTKPLVSKEARKLRASYYFMGAMLGKFQEAFIGQPGGCHLGPRPIDQHIKGFKALGAEVNITNDGVHLYAKELKGAEIVLDIASVGATINIMFAAVKAEGTTIIRNAAQEPEIIDVASFLIKMGAQIKGVGTDTIVIEGVEELYGCDHTVMPDRIEAGTYMIMSAAIGGTVLIDNIVPSHLEPLIEKLLQMGVNLKVTGNQVLISKSGQLKSVDIKTLVHPGFPTDLQQPFTALLNLCEGTATVTDTIYSERFKQIEEMKRMGAVAKVKGDTAIITGRISLRGAKVQASDLRAGAALVIAGLTAKGITEITGVEHIDRGYEEIVEKLTRLGASIWHEYEVEQPSVRSHFPKAKVLLGNVALANNNTLV